MTDRYAVMGNPISHSKSPRIHRLFAEQTGADLTYEALLVPVEGFAESVQAFFAAGGRGLSVTVPFKESALRLAQRVGPRAGAAGAANTLWHDSEGALCADNTDGLGLLADLTRNHGVRLAGSEVLVLGAGGAARGILAPLLEQRPRRVFIANRTPERARTLARAATTDVELLAGGIDEVPAARYDLILNATAASLSGELPTLGAEIGFAPHACAYDLMYAEAPTPFMDWARQRGAQRVLDGLGMLVEQAAEQFLLWRGVRPLTAPVLTALRPHGQGAR